MPGVTASVDFKRKQRTIRHTSQNVYPQIGNARKHRMNPLCKRQYIFVFDETVALSGDPTRAEADLVELGRRLASG